MKIKIFDEEHETDLEEKINDFLSDETIEVHDIKFNSSVSIYGDEQVFCFSALIMYKEIK